MKKNHYYRGNLPHWQPPEGTFFITYRLFGSIPMQVIQQLKEARQMAMRQIELENPLPTTDELHHLPSEDRKMLETIRRKKQYEEHKRHFKRLDDYLDGNLNEPHWLKNQMVAKVVADSIHHGAEKHYRLWAFTILSNHVHLLLTMLPKAPILWKVLQDSKKYTGRHANQILDRQGQFWEEESYDHLVRDERLNEPGEFGRILWYILNNPVKANLVKKWTDWPWTYHHPEFNLVGPNSSLAR